MHCFQILQRGEYLKARDLLRDYQNNPGGEMMTHLTSMIAVTLENRENKTIPS